MPTLSDLADVLIGCRVVSPARWDRAARAARAARGDPAAALDALAADTPEWFTPTAGGADAPPGLNTRRREAWDRPHIP